MTGLHDTDIRLDQEGQLTRATDGDAPLCSEMECFYQSIILEAQTQKGDLFYDPDFGWSLYDFLQSEDSDLTRLEIVQRARAGLLKREVIIPDSVQVEVSFSGDTYRLWCAFQTTEEETTRELSIIIDPVNLEVTVID